MRAVGHKSHRIVLPTSHNPWRRVRATQPLALPTHRGLFETTPNRFAATLLLEGMIRLLLDVFFPLGADDDQPALHRAARAAQFRRDLVVGKAFQFPRGDPA